MPTGRPATSGPSPAAGSEPRPVVLARADGGHGELVLRRRGAVLELIVDGVFAMDTAHTETETGLARLALERRARLLPLPTPAGPVPTPAGPLPTPAGPVPAPAGSTTGWRVLIGGLGLGFTTAAVLADPRVGAVDVVELQPDLPRWIRAGLVPEAGGLLDDPRVRVIIDDVRQVINHRPEAGLDAVILDVDNGPEFLVHTGNAEVYREPFLRTAIRSLAPGGALAIWSADPAPRLPALLTAAGGDGAEEVLWDLERDGRHLRYAIYLCHRPLAPGSRGAETGSPAAASSVPWPSVPWPLR